MSLSFNVPRPRPPRKTACWRCGRVARMPNHMYYTYVLQSLKDNNLYIGFTDNLDQRLSEHNNGRVTATKSRRPLKLVYYEACLNQEDAIKREKYLKTFYGKMFIHKRIKSYLTG